jgi:hypothetical protein
MGEKGIYLRSKGTATSIQNVGQFTDEFDKAAGSLGI